MPHFVSASVTTAVVMGIADAIPSVAVIVAIADVLGAIVDVTSTIRKNVALDCTRR
jgi:hypothetical protein